MKNLILVIIILFTCTTLFSQTYKLETVFSHPSETYLSHYKILESNIDVDSDTFSLWGHHLYYDDWVDGAYEVDYFKGNANKVFQFLTEIIQFTDTYKNEDLVLTYIYGVKVKTSKKILGIRATLVYDREGKVACAFNQKQWTRILNDFIEYCDKHKINYK